MEGADHNADSQLYPATPSQRVSPSIFVFVMTSIIIVIIIDDYPTS